MASICPIIFPFPTATVLLPVGGEEGGRGQKSAGKPDRAESQPRKVAVGPLSSMINFLSALTIEAIPESGAKGTLAFQMPPSSGFACGPRALQVAKTKGSSREASANVGNGDVGKGGFVPSFVRASVRYFHVAWTKQCSGVRNTPIATNTCSGKGKY